MEGEKVGALEKFLNYMIQCADRKRISERIVPIDYIALMRKAFISY